MKKYFLISISIAIGSVMLLVQNACEKDPTPIDLPEYVADTTGDTLCLSNIINGCLEDWTSADNGYDSIYYEPDGNYLSTLNELYTLPPALSGPGPRTTDRVTDSYRGKYAARLTSDHFFEIFIPGMLGTTRLDIPKSTVYVGTPYTERPVSFSGYYKYQPENGDSASIVIVVSKYNTTTNQRDTLGFGSQIIYSLVNEYTLFDIEVEYRDTTTVPDSLSLLMVSSAGFSLTDLQGAVGQLGSTLWIDQISLVME